MVNIGCVIKTPGNTKNNKILFCPDSCINKQHDIDYDYCKGCGICAYECPSDSIEMIQEESD